MLLSLIRDATDGQIKNRNILKSLQLKVTRVLLSAVGLVVSDIQGTHKFNGDWASAIAEITCVMLNKQHVDCLLTVE